MNKHIIRLAAIAGKPSRRIIGLMSGTSLDGLDIADCRITGSGADTKVEVLHFTTVNYDNDFKEEVRSVFSKKSVDLQKLTLLNEWIARVHAGMINKVLKEWGSENDPVDLIASHGQTIYHAPLPLHGMHKFGNGTLQIGDGDHLAVDSGIITISDFRQKHIAAGGEGAPLAAYGDWLLFRETGANVILLNIGGIANFSLIPSGEEELTQFFSTDVGPGNTLMDAFIQLHFPGKHFDENAACAKQGNVHSELLEKLKDHPFFYQHFPKTTGPELFNLGYLDKALEQLEEAIPVEDVMATLNRFTGEVIAEAINASIVPGTNTILYVSGGGMHNPLLMQTLEMEIEGVEWRSTTEKNIDPDAKEAVLFALLANETVAGDPQDFPQGGSNFPAVSMGKISLP